MLFQKRSIMNQY
uniref:Uncharacterized protein n=1 Tax=Rhizophora mucronata TaxID=61149 RepID=A0A2P2PJF1_RHIMU